MAMMEPLHVMIGMPVDADDLARIRAVDPRIEVQYAVEEIGAEAGRDPFSLFPLENPVRRQVVAFEEARAALDEMLADTEVLFGWTVPRDIRLRAPHLRWVQGTGAGLDMLFGDSGLPEGDVIITNAAGIRTVSVAEFVLCLMLMLAKDAPRMLKSKQERHWDGYFTLDLDGKALGIVGLGRIGMEVAKRAKAFGMKILAADRYIERNEKNAFGVDEVFPTGGLLQMLSCCDFVVLTVPLTAQTRGLIGESELRSMKPASYIINVARGAVIEQPALVRALKEAWIAGAGLDVFDPEPLPVRSELWDMPNVIVSAHMAGRRERITHVLTDLFCKNLKRYIDGREMVNLVDKKRGF